MILTTEKIGPNQALTPEGFLLCRDVAIARTGTQIYLAGEIGVDAGDDGLIHVIRDADQVFAPEAIASFEGKPITNLHPEELVSPDNWAQVAVGTIQNVRQQGSLLIADMLITQSGAIQAVRDGLREVSCGYEADYEQTEPGRAKQMAIVGNHVALVPKGRCGATCSIKDHETMKKPSWKGLLRAVIGTKDEAAIKATLDAMPDDEDEKKEDKKEDDIDKKVADAIAKAFKVRDEEAKKDDEDDKEKTDDEDGDNEEDDFTGDSFPGIVQRAAIIAPGLVMTAPSAKPKSKMFNDAACGCKHQALKQAYSTDHGKKAIDALLHGRTLDALKGAALEAVFDAAAVLMAAHNNTKDSTPRAHVLDATIQRNQLLAANIAKQRAALLQRHQL